MVGNQFFDDSSRHVALDDQACGVNHSGLTRGQLIGNAEPSLVASEAAQHYGVRCFAADDRLDNKDCKPDRSSSPLITLQKVAQIGGQLLSYIVLVLLPSQHQVRNDISCIPWHQRSTLARGKRPICFW